MVVKLYLAVYRNPFKNVGYIYGETTLCYKDCNDGKKRRAKLVRSVTVDWKSILGY